MTIPCRCCGQPMTEIQQEAYRPGAPAKTYVRCDNAADDCPMLDQFFEQGEYQTIDLSLYTGGKPCTKKSVVINPWGSIFIRRDGRVTHAYNICNLYRTSLSRLRCLLDSSDWRAEVEIADDEFSMIVTYWYEPVVIPFSPSDPRDLIIGLIDVGAELDAGGHQMIRRIREMNDREAWEFYHKLMPKSAIHKG